MKHAHDLTPGAGRVGHRPEQIEQRAHAELATHRGGVFHRAVMVGREHEADTDLIDAGRHLFRRLVDVDAERFQHVDAAAGGRHRTTAVLGHCRTGCRRDEGPGGGNVEGLDTVAAGTAGIDQMGGVVNAHMRGEAAHDMGRRRDLLHRFTLDPQTDEQGGDLRGRQLALHDLLHDADHLLISQIAPVDQGLQRLLECQLFHQ